MGLGELQLDRGHEIDVVAHSESVAIVRLAMAQGGEVAVGLLEGAALVTRVGGVAAGAIADLQETGIAVMRSRAAGQVVVVEDVEFADVFPGVGVVSGVDTVTPHSREGGGRQVLILDAGLEAIDSDLQAIEGAAQEHPDVAADDRAAADVARVVHFESAVGQALAVADEEVVGELLVAESLRAREPPPDGVRRHDAAVILEFEEARAPQRGRDLLAVVEGGVVVAVGRMEPPEPDGGRIRELIADLCALEIDADGARALGGLRLGFQRLNARRQLADQLQALVELLLERCDAVGLGHCRVGDGRMSEARHQQSAEPRSAPTCARVRYGIHGPATSLCFPAPSSRRSRPTYRARRNTGRASRAPRAGRTSRTRNPAAARSARRPRALRSGSASCCW